MTCTMAVADTVRQHSGIFRNAREHRRAGNLLGSWANWSHCCSVWWQVWSFSTLSRECWWSMVVVSWGVWWRMKSVLQWRWGCRTALSGHAVLRDFPWLTEENPCFSVYALVTAHQLLWIWLGTTFILIQVKYLYILFLLYSFEFSLVGPQLPWSLMLLGPCPWKIHRQDLQREASRHYIHLSPLCNTAVSSSALLCSA